MMRRNYTIVRAGGCGVYQCRQIDYYWDESRVFKRSTEYRVYEYEMSFFYLI